MSAAAYDPGKPTAVTPMGENRYSVDSYRGKDASYTVTLGERPTCTCPHFTARLAATPGAQCKHIANAKTQRQYLTVAERAQKLTDEQIVTWLKFHQEKGNQIVAGALRMERERRRQAKASEPKVWKSEKVFGPRTDEEAFGARR